MKRQPAFIQAMRDVAATMSVDLVDTFKFAGPLPSQPNQSPSRRMACILSQLFYQRAGLEHGHPTHQPARLRRWSSGWFINIA